MKKYSPEEIATVVSRLREFGYSQINNGRAAAIIEYLTIDPNRLRQLYEAESSEVQHLNILCGQLLDAVREIREAVRAPKTNEAAIDSVHRITTRVLRSFNNGGQNE